LGTYFKPKDFWNPKWKSFNNRSSFKAEQKILPNRKRLLQCNWKRDKSKRKSYGDKNIESNGSRKGNTTPNFSTTPWSSNVIPTTSPTLLLLKVTSSPPIMILNRS
jgi:hypothetical protein